MLLKKNDKAPYSGVLMPSEYVRSLEVDSEQLDLCRTEIGQLKDNTMIIPDIEIPAVETKAFWIGAGVSAALIGSLFIVFHK